MWELLIKLTGCVVVGDRARPTAYEKLPQRVAKHQDSAAT